MPGLTLFSWFKRSRFRFTVKALLAFMTAISPTAVWVGHEVRLARRYRHSCKYLGSIGARVYPFQQPSSGEDIATRARRLVRSTLHGDSAAFSMVVVTRPFDVGNRGQLKRFMSCLLAIPSLEDVYLDDVAITDAEVEEFYSLSVMQRLKCLELSGSRLGSTALSAMRQKLPQCEIRVSPISRQCGIAAQR